LNGLTYDGKLVTSHFHMRTSTCSNVAVMVEMSGAHGRGLMRGIAEYVQEKTQWMLHFEETGPIRTLPDWIKSWKGDGIIARIETPRIARGLIEKQIPLVNVAGRTSPAGVHRVDTDNKTVCELAVNHFRQRGFRHFAYCGNPQFEWSGWRQQFFSGLLAAERMVCATFQLSGSARSRDQLRAWLEKLPKPVGLFTANDLCGHAVLEACAQAGLEVPSSVAVLGVDNDEIICTLCRPQLSSIAPDTEGIGYLAAQTLHELMQGGHPGKITRQVKPLTVRCRQSTDAAAVEDWHVSQALRFILGHATRGIHVDDVVAQVHVSRRFLEKRFREVVGLPIHEEIFRVRFETAQDLLATTVLPLKEVAVRSGLRRADYLSVVFRRELGMSPSQFRKLKREDA
jgi:LacI family transcriptional regulator